MTANAVLPYRLLTLAVLGLAAIVGGLAGISPKFALAGAFALVYVVIVVENPALGLALFVGLIFLESVPAFEGLSLAKGAGALLAFSCIAMVATQENRARVFVRDHPALTAAIIVLGAWALVSAAWAEASGVALDAAMRWILNLTLFPIVYLAVRDASAVRWIFVLYVAGALLSAAMGLATGGVDPGEAGRLEGSGVNANDLGELLIPAVVLAAALGAARDLASPARMAAFGAAGLALIALVMTVSRGAILGLAVALLVTPLLIGPGRRVFALLGITAALAVGGGYLLVLAPAESRDRITHADTSGTGRTDIWKVGLRIVKDKPVFGVGAGNYPNSTVHYLLAPGTITRSDFIVDDPKAAHNVYLQVLAELGAIGMALFLAVIGFALWSLLWAARCFSRLGERSLELLSRALMIGLCGLLAAEFFSTAVYSKQLWLLLALAVAIRALARERSLAR